MFQVFIIDQGFNDWLRALTQYTWNGPRSRGPSWMWCQTSQRVSNHQLLECDSRGIRRQRANAFKWYVVCITRWPQRLGYASGKISIRQHCHLNVWRCIGWIDKYSACKFNQWIHLQLFRRQCRLISIAQMLVMCLFIHPVQYKHFGRHMYTIRSCINDKYWNRRWMKEDCL